MFKTKNPDEIAHMEMPCCCDCGNWFDLNDGHGCSDCNKIFCDDCVEEPWGICPQCQSWYDKNDEYWLDEVDKL